MPLGSVYARSMARSRALPAPARYAITAGITMALFGLRYLATPLLPSGYPFLLGFLGVMLSASLFNGRAGMASAGISTVAAVYFYLPPLLSLSVDSGPNLLLAGLFLGVSCVTAAIIETLHASLAELRTTEARRRLLLAEYKHRSRNDLQSLVALLLLRARSAKTDEARATLREAAGHARALARVHTRLQDVTPGADEQPVIDTKLFVVGLCEDLQQGSLGEGLRPIAFSVHAERHELASERAVQLGLVLNETVTNALKYAFPGDRAGMVQALFWRDGDSFVLEVRDDGVGLPDDGSTGQGLGTRLLRALAAQLRGEFSRVPAPGGGTLCTMRFAADP